MVGAINRWLKANEDLEHSLPTWAGVRSLDNYAVNIFVIAHTGPHATREYGVHATT